MTSTESKKKRKGKVKDEPMEEWEKELNIKYHDVNPEWNYTIYPRSTKQTKKDKK